MLCDTRRMEMIDKLLIALLMVLYAGTGESFLPAWSWYVLAGLNMLMFCTYFAEWIASKIDVRLK